MMGGEAVHISVRRRRSRARASTVTAVPQVTRCRHISSTPPAVKRTVVEAAKHDGALLQAGGGGEFGQLLFSRTVYGARLSLSIGFVGVILSLVLGILLGGISGYFGGTIDLVIRRAIELLQAIPRIPLWLTLSAALPRD